MVDATDEFQKVVALTVKTGMKLKERMKTRGLRKAWTKCPKCDGRLEAVLVGHKFHMHMRCRTPGCLQMME